MIEEGTVLQKRYRIGKRIGEGGMGAVYLATDERFGSQVAIKETLFTDTQYKKAFKREARLLNSLKHPALPKVSDHFIENNGQYIVMEYIAGDDLFETLEKTKEPFPVADVQIWSEQLLDALEYLHGQENPVIHRDIKPQNLKMTPDGQVILLDFGLAKGNPTDANHKTAAQSIFGYSRNYASLEQIQGTGTDPRSDIYSLAATLYHLVTGIPPADALTRVMMVLNEENDPLIPASEVHEQVSESLSNVLYQAMALNANVRPQSTNEMRGMLSGEISVESAKSRETVSNKAPDTGLLAQKTQVLSNKTGVQGTPSELKTEILPSGVIQDESVATKISPAGTAGVGGQNTGRQFAETQSSSWSPRYAVAAALASFLLVGSVIGGALYFGSDVFGGAASVDQTESPDVSKPDASAEISNPQLVNSNSSENESATEMTDNETPVSDSSSVSTVKRTEVEKPKISAKKTENVPLPKKPKIPEALTKTKTNKRETLIKDGKVITRDVTIANGKVETPDMIVDGDKVILKRKSASEPRVVMPRNKAEFDRLTPAQKKRWLKFTKMKRYPGKKGRRPPPPRPRPRKRLPSNRPD